MTSNARDPTASLDSTGHDACPWFAALVEQAQQGDTSAFDVLYRHFYLPIRRYLGHLVGDAEEGCDLAQETFLKAWQNLPGIRGASRFDTWLYRIATNTALDHLRRRKFRWPRWKQNDTLPLNVYVPGPEERVGEVEHIQQALAQVSLKYRCCLLLQLVACLSQREIASSLHISEKSVSIYVSRGSEQFRLAYQRLLQENEESLKKKGQVYESRSKVDAHALYRLGSEA
jgi:RNA polymerase sigma-70 factor, ECF subfamily